MTRNLGRLSAKEWRLYESAYRMGIRAAAAFAGTWDRQIASPYRFDDIILGKFNLRSKPPRKKRWK